MTTEPIEPGSPGDPVTPGIEPGGEPGSGFQGDFGAFKESLGELGKDKAFEPIKDFEGWAKSYVDLNKMIGRSIRLPGDDLSPEDKEKHVKELRGKLMEAGIIEGVPESPEGYQYERPTLGDGLQWDSGFVR